MYQKKYIKYKLILFCTKKKIYNSQNNNYIQ